MSGASGHRQAGIPRELADAIDDMVRRHRWLGHRSMSGFATEACRRLLRECYEDIERRERVGDAHLMDAHWMDGSGREPDGPSTGPSSPRRRASNHGSPS